MKPYIIIQGPVATRSGYGNHTRDLVTALISADKYEIGIISMPWGSCPMNALEPDNEVHQQILKRLVNKKIEKQPDVYLQISVPNEFCRDPKGNATKPGKVNIGITAGIETTIPSHEFILGCNRMDLVITTSEHSKNTLATVAFDEIDEKTKQKKGVLKLKKPIEVLFEGADLNVYNKTSKIHDTVIDELKDIKEDFCFLYVGHWLKGMLGQDRKDTGMMLKTMCETWKRKSSKNRPGIILKTSQAGFSILDRDAIMRKIQSIIQPYGDKAPNIYLLHGDLTDGEMNSLYNHPKVKSMVSFAKGEGFGRPLLEFSLTGKPVIASNWSGQVDFLHEDYSVMLPGQLTNVHSSAADQFILKDAQWFTVNYQFASKVLADVKDNYKQYLEKSRKQGHYSKTNFSLELMSKKFCNIIDETLKTVPQQVQLKMPELKKKKPTAAKKIKLPKLKKVEA